MVAKQFVIENVGTGEPAGSLSLPPSCLNTNKHRGELNSPLQRYMFNIYNGQL